MKRAIIACCVFYEEIRRLLSDSYTPVVLIHQGIHDYPNSTQMRDCIQKEIDTIEHSDAYDEIILVYGYCGGGIVGLKTKQARLVVPRVQDCIALLISDIEREYVGRSFFLSRGWIDCGGDTYKEYLGMVGRADEGKQLFLQCNAKDALVNWYEKKQYKTQRKFDSTVAKSVCYECIKHYTALVLIDNGNLTPFHVEYIDLLYNFTSALLAEKGRIPLKFSTLTGNLSLLKKLIDHEYTPEILVYEKGCGIQMNDFIR